jgi:hypothetical protein
MNTGLKISNRNCITKASVRLNFSGCALKFRTARVGSSFFFLVIFLPPIFLNAQSGINESFAILSLNGGANAYYDLNASTANPDFEGASLGTFSSSNALTLNGAQNKVYKCNTDDITANNFYYRIYKTTDPAPGFTSSTIFFTSNDGLSGSGCGGSDQNQTWQSAGAGINVLSGLATPGTYYLEIYTTADFTYTSGGGGSGTHYANNGASNYKAQFTLSSDCVSGISVNPTAAQTLCQAGAPNTLTATITTCANFGAGSLTYDWYSNTSNSTVGGTLVQTTNTTTATLTSIYTPSSAIAGTLWYYCVVTNLDASCPVATYATTPVQVSINPTITPSASILANPSGAICAGTSVTFTATPVNGGSTPTYQWKLDGVNIAGETGVTYTSTSLSNGQKVSVVMTSNESCLSTAIATSNELTEVVNPIIVPSVSIAPSATRICSGTTVTFTATPINGGGSPSYQWNLNGANVGSNSDSYNNSGLVNGDVVTVDIVSNGVCAVPTTATATSAAVTIRPITSAPDVPTGTAIVCPSIIGLTYTVPSVANTTAYSWTVPSGWTITGGSTTNSLIVNTQVAATSGNIIVSVNDSCGSNFSNSLAITVKPPIPARPSTITGSTTVCPSISGNYSIAAVANADANGYVWTVPAGWSITAGQGTTNVTVLTGATGTDGNITVTASNSCGTSPSQTRAITVRPAIPATPDVPSGSNPVCPTTAGLIYSVPAVLNATSYTWTFPSGWSITAGSTTNSITVSATSLAVSGNITIIANNICGSSVASVLAVVVSPAKPATPGTITGATPVCPGTTGLSYLITAVTNATTYNWTVPIGWTITSGQGSPAITVTAGATGDNGSITVTASNSCGTSAAATKSVTVSNGAPATPGTIAGSLEQCINKTSLSYNITAVANASATGYVWTVPSGWTITSSGTTNGISVSTSGSAVAGNITVTASNSCGTSPAQSLAVITSPGTPSAPAAPTGPSSICPTVSGLVYTIAAVANATSYLWTLPTGWSITSGSSTNTITVTATAPTAVSGNISVKAVNACGTSIASANLPVTVGNFAFVNANADISVCAATPTATLAATVGGATGTNNVSWTSSNGGSFANAGKASTTYTPGAAAIAAGTVTLTVTTDDPSGSCVAVSDQLILTIKPAPTASISGATAVCSSSSTNITFTGTPNTTVTYKVNSGANQTIAIDGTGSATLSTGALIANAVYSLQSVIYSIAPVCTSVSLTSSPTVTVTVNSPATVNANADQTVCGSSPSVTLAGSVGGSASSGTWSGGTGTFSPNSTTLNAVYTPNAAEITAGTATLTLTTNDPAGPCPAVSDQMIITINPVAVANGNIDQVVCASSPAVTLAGAVSGAASSGTWSGGTGTYNPNTTTLNAVYTPSAAEVTAGAVTLTLTTNDPTGPCNAVTDQVLITINPVATANANIDQITCASSPDVTLAGSVGGAATAGAWSGGAGTFNPNSSTLNAVYTPTSAEIASGSVTLTLTTNDPAGPCLSVTDNVLITINAAAISSPAAFNYLVCSNSTINLNGSVGGDASSGTWSGGAGSYSPSAGTLNAVYTPTAAEKAAGTLTLTLTTNDPSGPCPAVSDTKSFTINPEVIVSAGPNAAICSGSTFLTAGTLGGGGTQGFWNTNGTGTFGVGSHPVYTPSLVDITAASVTLSYRTNNPNGPCEADTATMILTINSAVAITTQPVNVAVCATYPANLTVVASGSGLSYQWYKGTYPGAVVSNSSNISGATSSILHFNQAATANDGTYYVVVSGASPCASVVSSGVTLSVDQQISITSQPVAATVCIGATNISFSITATASDPLTYQWRKNGVNVGTNSNTYTIPSVALSDAGSYDVVISGPGSYACANATSASVNLVVNSNSTISLASASGTDAQTSCINAVMTPIAYTIGGGGTGASITAGALPPGVTGNFAGGVFTISGTPTVSGNFSYTVTTTGPCSNASLSGTITLLPGGTINLTSGVGTNAQTKCINNALTPITYAIGGSGSGAGISSGALPAGVTGTYSGGVFTISGTPTASGSFSYTVTTSGSCAPAALSGTITVNANSTLTRTSAASTSAQTRCINTALTVITYSVGGGGTGATISAGALPSGVTGSFNAGVFTISGTPTVSGSFNYTVTTTGPCTNTSLSGTITVTANSTISRSSAVGTDAQTKCISTALTNITYAIGGGGTGASITAGALPSGVTGSYSSGVFTISGTPTVSGSFSYTVTTAGTCVNTSLSGTIIVNANSTISRSSAVGTDAQVLCFGSGITNITYNVGGGATSASITAGALPAGVTGSYSGGIFTISGTPTASGSFSYTVTTVGPCTNPGLSGTIVINPAPVGGTTTSSSNLFACAGSNAGLISLTGQSGTISKWQSSIDGGTTWTDISTTTSSLSYTNLTQTTWYRAVITQPGCIGVTAYSAHTIINVVPQSGASSLAGTANPTVICSGSSTLTATGIGAGSTIGTIEGGSFDQAGSPLEGPGLWRATETGSSHNIEGSANNGTNPFNLTNGPKEFFGPPSYASNPYTVTYNNNPLGGQVNNNKFMVANGLVNCTLETPIFTLVGLQTASITWWEAYILQAGAYIRMEISTDGGNTYNSLLRPDITGPVSYASPTNFQQTSVDLSAYAGLSNLRVRFTYYSTTYSSWGLEMATITKATTPAVYTWNLYQPAPVVGTPPAHYLNVFTANSVTVTPPTPNITNAPIIYYYSLSSSGGGCASNITVTVNPSPKLTHTTVSPVCTGTALSPNITFSSTLSGTTYSYTINNPGGVTGLITTSNGTISGTPVNPTSVSQTVRFIATGTVSGSCPGIPDTVDLVVNPGISVALSGSQTICGAGSSAILTLTSAGPFPFSVILSNGISYLMTSSPGNITVNPGVTTNYTISSLSGACPAAGGLAGNANISVNPSPVITHSSASPVCSGSALSPNITFSSTLSGTTYSYTISNPGGVTGLVTNASGTVSGTPVNPTSVAQTVRFIATGTVTGCPGTPDTVDVVVNPYASVALSGSQTICGAGSNAVVTLTSAGPFPFTVTLSNGVTYTMASSPKNITVNPVATTNYTITSASITCSSSSGLTGNANISVISTAGITGTWLCGAGDGDWFNPCNWANGIIPTNSIDVIINSASSTCNPVIDPTTSYALLNGPIALSRNITISGTRNLSFANGGDLYVAGNWLNNVGSAGFTANTGTVTMMGSSLQTITSTAGSTEAFYNLRINNSSSVTNGVTLNSNITVSHTLTLLAGIVNTHSNPPGGTPNALGLLTMTATANPVAGSPGVNSFINGQMAKQFTTSGSSSEYAYPIGKVIAGVPVYKDMAVQPTTTSGTTTFTSEYFPTAHPIPTVMLGLSLIGGVPEYWQVDQGGGTANAMIKIPYANPGNGNWIGNNNAPVPDPCSSCNVAVIRKDILSNGWDFTALSGNFSSVGPQFRYYQNNGYIYSAPVSAFGPFTNGYAFGVILPVQLLTFDARLINGDGKLNWTIADSKDVAGFEIEHSRDGRSYSTLTVAKPTGGQTAYTYVHNALAAGSHYYRLLVKDKNGTSFYSKTVLLVANKNITVIKGLKPTMVTSQTSLSIKSAQPQQMFATLFDAAGRTVAQYKANLVTGENNYMINAIMLAKGQYNLFVQTEDGITANLRFVKE